MEMPFGKYEGRDVTTLPRPYCKWCIENLNIRDHELLEELEARANGVCKRIDESPRLKQELIEKQKEIEELRQSLAATLQCLADTTADKLSFKEVNKIFQAACLKYHPDRGGSHQAQVAVNDLWAQVKKLQVSVGS